MTEEDWTEIARLMAEARSKRRGHADFFEGLDKDLKEWGIAQVFCEEMERNVGLNFVDFKQHPGGKNYALDRQFTVSNGQVWGAEITELVSENAIKQSKCGKTVFEERSVDVLVKKITSIIAKKDRQDTVRGGSYDRYILIVHTDEYMLTANYLRTVLDFRSFQT